MFAMPVLTAIPDVDSNSPTHNGRERQAAEAAEEARRKAEVAAKKAALQAALQSQLQEHTASKQQAAAAQREELANINQSIQVAQTTLRYTQVSLVTWKGTAAMCSMHPASCLQPQLDLGASKATWSHYS